MEALEGWLGENKNKPRQKNLTLIRLYEQPRETGYESGYDAVRRYARGWQQQRSAMPSEVLESPKFDPGAAYQFDFSHEVVVLNGATSKVKVAHLGLCHSRMFFVRPYPCETREVLFAAHKRAFSFCRGACVCGIYDNLATAVGTDPSTYPQTWQQQIE